MHSLSRTLSQIALWLSALGLVGMTAIIGWQVFARYVLNSAPSWTEQAGLFLMLWFILFAAAAGVREGFHIRLSLLQDALKGKPRIALLVFCHLVVLTFGVVMAVAGAELAARTWQHTIPAINVPRGLSYLPLSGAGGLIVFFSIEHIIATLRGTEVKPLWN